MAPAPFSRPKDRPEARHPNEANASGWPYRNEPKGPVVGLRNEPNRGEARHPNEANASGPPRGNEPDGPGFGLQNEPERGEARHPNEATLSDPARFAAIRERMRKA
jgi:hypothetical protein